MKSQIAKRSVVVAHHKTSVSLEEPFWNGLRAIASERGIALSALIETIDTNRQSANLSSAIRLFVLRHFCDQVATLQVESARDRDSAVAADD